MVRTSPSLATNQRALERRDAPLSSRRNDDSAGSSHRDHRSQGRDESPRRASSYNEHSSSSHRDRRRPDRDDRSDYPLDNDFSAHSPYSHHPRAMQPSSRALREKHSEEKDLIETYEAEIKRIQDLRKQLLMPAASNGPPPPSRRAASPPSVSFDMSHNEYSAPSRSSCTAEYERDRNSANRLSDPFRASPPPAMPIIVNRRGTDPIRAPEQQHMLQQDRLGLYFGGQAVPVLQRNISDSQRTSNGDGYLCDVDEDDGEERRRRESEATDFVDENDDESDSGSDGRAEGQEDEGGAGRHPKSLSSVVLTLKHPEPHSSGLMRGGVGRSPPMGPKAVPVYDPSAMDSMSAPSQPLSSALRAPAPPFKRSSPQMQGVNGDIPELPSLASAARSHYAVPDQLPSRHSPVDHGTHSKPNFVPAYNVPVLGRRDDRDQAPLPPASASSPLSPSAQAAAAQKQARPLSAEAEALRVQSDALRALQLTVGAHDSVPAKSCCAVM